MEDFSQYGEQKIVLDFFRGQKGTFLDCGTNDGVTLSNTRALAIQGWGGVCIEPALTPFHKLRELYKDNLAIQCINAAIADREGEITLWESGTHLNKGDTSLLSTLRPEEKDRWIKSGEKFTAVKCEAITIKQVLEQSWYNNFDFVSIDCEGEDYNILCQMPLREMGCSLLCVETNGKDEKRFIDQALKEGMVYYCRTPINLFFRREHG